MMTSSRRVCLFLPFPVKFSKNQSKRRYDSADFIIRDTMVSGPTVCGNEQLQ